MAERYVQKIEFQAKIKDLEKKLKRGEKSLGGLKASALAAGAALATMGAFAMKSVKAFAQFEGVNEGFKNLSKNAGFSSQALGKLKRATDNTVDSISLMKQANSALLLGIVENEDELAGLMDTAQRLGRALGLDTAQAVESLTTGMGRQSKLMLDNLGIMIDTQGAYEKFAEAQGTTVSLLTDEQKKRAFNIETMRQAKEMVEALGEEQLSANDSLNQISNAFTQISITIGQQFAPALNGIARLMTSMVQTDLSDELLQEKIQFQNLVAVIKDSNTSTESRTMAIKDLKKNHGQYLSGLKSEEDILTNIDRINTNYIKHTEDRITQQIFQEELDEREIARKEIQRKLLNQELRMSKNQRDMQKAINDGNKGYQIVIQDRIDAMQRHIDTSKAELAIADERRQSTLDEIATFKQRFDAEMVTNKILAEGKIDSMKQVDFQVVASSDLVVASSQKESDAIAAAEDRKKKSYNAMMSARKQMVQSEIQSSMQLGTALAKGGEEAKSAALEHIIAYTSSAIAKQMQKIIIDYPFPANLALSVVGGAAVGASMQYLREKVMSAQTGASYIAGGEQMLQVGEAGAEEVNVTPLDDPTGGSTSSGGGSTIVFNNPILTETLIEDEIIPMIQRAVDRGSELN